MRRSFTALLVVSLVVAGCGGIRDSKLNPFNWFGRSRTVQVAELPPGVQADGRILVDQVLSMEVAHAPGGAIVTAVGLPPTQGWWEAELVAENRGKPDENGVLTYRFVVFPPTKNARVSTQQSREVTAGAFLSDVKLEDIREIVVQGARTSRASRR